MSKKTIQLSFFILFTLGISVILFFIFKPYLAVIFISAVFTVAFYPLYERLTEKLAGRKNLASLTTTFIIFIFIIIPITILSGLLLKEAVGLYTQVSLGENQKLIEQAETLVNKVNFLLPSGVSTDPIDLASYTRSSLNWVIGHFGSVFSIIFGGIFNFILMILSLYYLFIYGEKIKNGLVMWSPLPDHYDEEFIKTLRSSIDAVLRGRLLVSIAQGVFIGLGFYIFRVGSPVLWGFVGGITSLVPMVGTSIVTIPAILYLFLSGHIGLGIGLLLWAAIAVGLVDNIISMFFLKNKINIHPLVVLFSILGGVEAFGAVGFLVGPVVVSAFVSMMKIYPFIMSPKIE